jgi:hypothetical protein
LNHQCLRVRPRPTAPGRAGGTFMPTS